MKTHIVIYINMGIDNNKQIPLYFSSAKINTKVMCNSRLFSILIITKFIII